MKDILLDDMDSSQSDGVDGGAAGSGLAGVAADPTQGRGTPAWQAAQKMAMIVNARQRRN